jgi:hypothetical protein
LHEPFHGLHHRNAGWHHYELPGHADELIPKTPEETTPYPNYRSAVWDLVRDLADPKVGPQWHSNEAMSRRPAESDSAQTLPA